MSTEVEIIHHAAENIQRIHRGNQARAKTPPISLEAQASAELSADLIFAEETGVSRDKVVTMYTEPPPPIRSSGSPTSTLKSSPKPSPKSSPPKSSPPKSRQSKPRYTGNKTAAIAIQKTMRGHLGKQNVRLKRGSVHWHKLPLDRRPTHGWISIKDVQKRRYYYYHHSDDRELIEFRWMKPSPIVFLPAHHFFDAISGLSSKVEMAERIDVYFKHHTVAIESIDRAKSKIKSSLNKCKALLGLEKQCRNYYIEDMESIEAGFDMLEEAHQSTTDFIDTILMEELCTAQSDILEKLSSSCERVAVDYKKNMDNGLLIGLGTKPGDPNIQAMLTECKRAIYDVIGWWEKEEDEVPEDTRLYLQLEGWNGKSRSDWYPIHTAIEAASNCCTLLKECMAHVIEDAQREGEEKRESENLNLMKLEEIAQRSYMRKKKAQHEKWAKKENELTMLRSAWRYGLYQKEKDLLQDATKARDLQLAKELLKTERLQDRRREDQQMNGDSKDEETGGAHSFSKRITHKTHLTKYRNSPWYGVERGCSRYELEELIGEERKRRTNQEGRKVPFHVDDCEHESGKLLLHTACFWGQSDLVDYLLARGANPIRIDSCVTRFTPLDEACRGGSPIVVKSILHAAALAHGGGGKMGSRSGRSSMESKMAALYVKNIHGDTPIHTAAREGRSQAMLTMINYCKNCGCESDSTALGPDGGGTSEGADAVFDLIDCTNGKHKTPLQLTTNDGVKELLLAASEWAIDARANQGVFGMAMKKKKGKKGGGGKNTMGKWLQELNPNAY
jgi:hypothetical protein